MTEELHAFDKPRCDVHGTALERVTVRPTMSDDARRIHGQRVIVSWRCMFCDMEATERHCRANPKAPHMCAYTTYNVGSDCKEECLYRAPVDLEPDTPMTPDLEVWVRNQRSDG